MCTVEADWLLRSYWVLISLRSHVFHVEMFQQLIVVSRTDTCLWNQLWERAAMCTVEAESLGSSLRHSQWVLISRRSQVFHVEMLQQLKMVRRTDTSLVSQWNQPWERATMCTVEAESLGSWLRHSQFWVLLSLTDILSGSLLLLLRVLIGSTFSIFIWLDCFLVVVFCLE